MSAAISGWSFGFRLCDKTFGDVNVVDMNCVDMNFVDGTDSDRNSVDGNCVARTW